MDLQDHLDNYCNVFDVFGFNSAKYDIKLLKSYLLPLLRNERDFEPIVIKTPNQFVSFNFGGGLLLDILSFLGGATRLDFFMEVSKTSETKCFFFHMNGSMIQKSSTMLNCLLTKPPLASCATIILSKKTIQTVKA